MKRDRLIQLAAGTLALLGIGAAGSLLPAMIDQSDRHALRYTDVSVEGAPLIVTLGTVFGALRGLVVDYLWIKVHFMKEKGLFYEVMADAELITKLQPRFAAVWAFHGHNMAYNISVATHTEQERWDWVNAGIRLVRNEGLRYNPNDLQLHRELSFWFAHKIEGVVDDAHLYYKTQFCKEWHYLLGEPPAEQEDRVEWLRVIAEAPATLAEARAAQPGITPLIADLERVYRDNDQELRLGHDLLRAWQEWYEISSRSAAAEILGTASEYREQRPFFRDFDAVAGNPEHQAAWELLIAHLRRRVLADEYNMEAERMMRYTAELGPIDWRNAQAHALYWSRRGSEVAEQRVFDPEDVYKVLNNDRIQLQAMQGLARFGRTYFDPFSNEMPGRYPDPRWVDVIAEEFNRVYVKHYDARGGGPESFIGFLQNFMSSSIREWYRAGEDAKAQELLDRMDELFGSGQGEAIGRDSKWSLPLDVFVQRETEGEYEFQPHMALSDVSASLRYGYVEGLGRERREVLEKAQKFAAQVREHFQGNRYNDYVNKFGRGRMSELVGALEDAAVTVFAQVMTDRSIELPLRLNIWREAAGELPPEVRAWSYDMIREPLSRELATSVYGEKYTLDQIIPPPPDLEQWRARLVEFRRAAEQQRQAEQGREGIERR